MGQAERRTFDAILHTIDLCVVHQHLHPPLVDVDRDHTLARERELYGVTARPGERVDDNVAAAALGDLSS